MQCKRNYAVNVKRNKSSLFVERSSGCAIVRRNAVKDQGEDFLVGMLRQARIDFAYLKSTRERKTPDYLIAGGEEKLVVEIGGNGKGRQQFKGVDIDRKLVFSHTDTPTNGRIPLFMIGYLI